MFYRNVGGKMLWISLKSLILQPLTCLYLCLAIIVSQASLLTDDNTLDYALTPSEPNETHRQGRCKLKFFFFFSNTLNFFLTFHSNLLFFLPIKHAKISDFYALLDFNGFTFQFFIIFILCSVTVFGLVFLAILWWQCYSNHLPISMREI